MGKRIAILGAGPSGLAAAKSALENGLEPIVFEKSDDIGGVWRLQTGSTWNSLRTNLSKFSCMFSDFPWPENTQEFPSQEEMYTYLQTYIKHFSLKKYITLNCVVTGIKQSAQSWHITWRIDNSEKNEIFDFVIIASGIFSEPFIPSITNLNEFPGKWLHSNDYKSPEEFKGKKVIVVGGSYSGVEIAVDLVNNAEHVVNVITKPSWILPRYIPKSPEQRDKTFPLDLVFYQRATRSTPDEIVFPTVEAIKIKNVYMSKLCGGDQSEIDPALKMNIDSPEPPFAVVSDGYIDAIRNRKISLKNGRVIGANNKGLIFADGSHENADVVIFCTGYSVSSLSFLDKAIANTIELNSRDQLQPLLLYKSTFHPKLPGIAFVGMYRGPYYAIMELQARWATMVFTEQARLPSEAEMLAGIDIEKRVRIQAPRPQFPHADYVGLADSIAAAMGVLPDFAKLKSEDPKLYQALWSGPVIPSHYRLTGPNANASLAKNVIAEAMRVFDSKISAPNSSFAGLMEAIRGQTTQAQAANAAAATSGANISYRPLR
jgi:dimethylaniline monooxygenase (N-oxide forming)